MILDHLTAYFRLIEETDEHITISPNGLEIPGVECVHFIAIADTKIDKTRYILTFEDGRKENTKFYQHLTNNNGTITYIMKKTNVLPIN